MNDSASLEILYSDDDLVAVNKPAGMVSIRDGHYPERQSVHQMLAGEFGKLWIVHRLDVDTSGVMLFGRNSTTHRLLNMQFEHHTIQKTYHLLVFGSFDWQEVRADLPLRVNGDRRHRTIIDRKTGKPASTLFQSIEGFPDDFALLAANPKTGYTHQIRSHASALGLWLLNDPLYFPLVNLTRSDAGAVKRNYLFDKAAQLPIKRTALHASSIQFQHPTTQGQATILAPFPADFSSTISQMKQG